jgi:hypothetical protein
MQISPSPTLIEIVAYELDGWSFKTHMHVMPKFLCPIDRPVHYTVIMGVPPVAIQISEIDAAQKGDFIVNYDGLLVMCTECARIGVDIGPTNDALGGRESLEEFVSFWQVTVKFSAFHDAFSDRRDLVRYLLLVLPKLIHQQKNLYPTVPSFEKNLSKIGSDQLTWPG